MIHANCVFAAGPLGIGQPGRTGGKVVRAWPAALLLAQAVKRQFRLSALLAVELARSAVGPVQSVAASWMGGMPAAAGRTAAAIAQAVALAALAAAARRSMGPLRWQVAVPIAAPSIYTAGTAEPTKADRLVGSIAVLAAGSPAADGRPARSLTAVAVQVPAAGLRWVRQRQCLAPVGSIAVPAAVVLAPAARHASAVCRSTDTGAVGYSDIAFVVVQSAHLGRTHPPFPLAQQPGALAVSYQEADSLAEAGSFVHRWLKERPALALPALRLRFPQMH